MLRATVSGVDCPVSVTALHESAGLPDDPKLRTDVRTLSVLSTLKRYASMASVLPEKRSRSLLQTQFDPISSRCAYPTSALQLRFPPRLSLSLFEQL